MIASRNFDRADFHLYTHNSNDFSDHAWKENEVAGFGVFHSRFSPISKAIS